MCIFEIISFIKDINYIKNNDFQYLTSEVIDYNYIREGNSPDYSVQSQPIFYDVNTQNKDIK